MFLRGGYKEEGKNMRVVIACNKKDNEQKMDLFPF